MRITSADPIVKLNSDNIKQYSSFVEGVDKIFGKNIAHVKPGAIDTYELGGKSFTTNLFSNQNNQYVFEVDIQPSVTGENSEPARKLYRVWDDLNEDGVVNEGDEVSIRDVQLKTYNDIKEGETVKAFEILGRTFERVAAVKQKNIERLEKNTEKSGLNDSDKNSMINTFFEQGLEVTHQGKIEDGTLYVIGMSMMRNNGIVFMGKPGEMNPIKIKNTIHLSDGGTWYIYLENDAKRDYRGFYFPSPLKKNEKPAYIRQSLTEFDN